MDYKYKKSIITTLIMYLTAIIVGMIFTVVCNLPVGILIGSIIVFVRAVLSFTFFKKDLRRYPVVSGIIEGISFIMAYTLFWAIVI